MHAETMSEHQLRIRSAMVLFQLENSIGELVNSFAEEGSSPSIKQIQPILKREGGDGPIDGRESTEQVVAASYIGELLDLAISAAQNRPEKKPLKVLKDLSSTLDLFSIRNAIAHPNRPFADYHWYRVTAIATDPSIEELGFEGVRKAFYQAREGNLNPPPEDWLSEPKWSLPNNLPTSFDHDITGLIGRENEKKEIKEKIRSERISFLAIVARGGIGKTALLLDVLNDIISSPDSLDWTDEVVYISSKTDKLTPDGIIEANNPASTLMGLRKTLAEVLEKEKINEDDVRQIINKHKHKRVLLCLDNLETILRDSPQEFNNFYYTLPGKWKVVVTSRIPVDGAVTVPLNPLDEDGAGKFAHIYARRRGFERINHEEVVQLVESTDRNPLAIRLSIDSLITGGSLPDAITSTKKKIVQFSYNNLISNISSVSKGILECLFVSTEPIGRAEMVSLLGQDIDAVAEGLTELMRTSLCKRVPSEHSELYEISSSVRDLLLVEPADEEARQSIEEKRRAMRQDEITTKLYQEKEDSSPLSIGYLSGLQTHIHHIASNALRAYFHKPFDRAEAVTELQKIRSAIAENSTHPELHRIAGALMIKLGDREKGKQRLREAVKSNNFDPPAALHLSITLRRDKEYEEAVKPAEELLSRNWGDPRKGGDLSREVVKAYYLPQIWLGNTEAVIKETSDWENRKELSELYGSLHADALHNAARYDSDNEEAIHSLIKSIKTNDRLLRLHGYSGYLVAGAMKLTKRIYEFLSGSKTNSELILSSCRFIDRHLINLSQAHNEYSIDDPEVRRWVSCIASAEERVESNIFSSVQWSSYLSKNVEFETELPYGVETSVQHIPKPKYDNKRRAFLFAVDIDGQKYFLHKSALDTTSQEWEQIEIGDQIGVVDFKEPEEPDKLPEVTSAWYLEHND